MVLSAAVWFDSPTLLSVTCVPQSSASSALVSASSICLAVTAIVRLGLTCCFRPSISTLSVAYGISWPATMPNGPGMTSASRCHSYLSLLVASTGADSPSAVGTRRIDYLRSHSARCD